MFQELAGVLDKHRLFLKAGETQVLASTSLPNFEDYFGTRTLTWEGSSGKVDIRGVHKLAALGVALDRAGTTIHSYDHRRGQADANFFANKKDLRCTKTGPEHRIRAFHRTSGGSMAFGSMGWIWTPALAHNICAWEYRRLRSVLRIRWKGQDITPWTKYIRDSATLIRTIFAKYEIQPIILQLLAGLFGWAHKLVHTSGEGPEYPLLKLLTGRGEPWCRGLGPLLAKNPRRDQDFKDLYRHRRPGTRTRLWDWLLVEVLGLDWEEQLRNIDSLTKETKHQWARQAALKLGVRRGTIPKAIGTTARGPAEALKHWKNLAKEAHDQCVLDISRKCKQHSDTWREEIHCWDLEEDQGGNAIEIISDNQLVASWTSGISAEDGPKARKAMKQFWKLTEAALKLKMKTNTLHHNLTYWTPRALTGAADLVCNICLDTGHDHYWLNPELTHFAGDIRGIRWIGDGAARHNGHSSYATIGIASLKTYQGGYYFSKCLSLYSGNIRERL